MAEINGEEKRIVVSGEQIEEAVGKVPTIEADVKSNKQNISALQADVSKHTEDIAKNTADIEKKANADEVYSRDETDSAITAKVAEIVAGAPEEFDTLKEMSDWLTEHSDSAATMNTAIQANTKAIADNATAIEGNTADIEQNKSDILTAEKAIEINRLTLGTQITKNILKLGTINPTNGLTVTVNADKSLNVNGTVDSFNAVTLMKGLKLSLGKRYTMSVSDINTNITLTIGDVKREETWTSTNTQLSFTPKVETNNVWIQGSPGTVIDNVTLYPMIRSADIADSTYEPHVSPLQEQINEIIERIQALETSAGITTVSE